MNLTRIGLVMLMLGLSACGGSQAPSAPSAPSGPAQPPAVDPVAQPTGLQPTITVVSPNVVSIDGTWGTIIGTQFQPGATVKIAGVAVGGVFRDSTTITFANSGAHTAGAVDVTVTNPGGFAATLASGYTYAAADSFDANGEWIAHADAHNDYTTDMRFTISDNMLISLSCGTTVTMPTTVSVRNGSFSFAGPDGLTISGSLASTTTAYGQVTAPGCGDGRWWGDKSSKP